MTMNELSVIADARLLSGELEQYLGKPLEERILPVALAACIDRLLRNEFEIYDLPLPLTQNEWIEARINFLLNYMGVIDTKALNGNQMTLDVEWNSTVSTFLGGKWRRMTHKYDRRKRQGLES